MIKLNHFQRYDTDELESYLASEAKQGNLLCYLSGLFLIFKKANPQDLYFKVIPKEWRAKHLKIKQVNSSVDYLVYQDVAPITVETNQRYIATYEIILASILTPIWIMYYAKSFLNLYNPLKNFLILITILLCPICLYFGFRLKQNERYKEKTKKLPKQKVLSVYIFLFLIICFIGFACFGDLLRSSLFILMALFFFFIPIKEIVFWILFASVSFMFIAFINPPLIQNINTFNNHEVNYHTYLYNQSGVLRYEDSYVSWEEDSDWRGMSCDYYETKTDWLKPLAKREDRLEWFFDSFNRYEEIEETPFNYVYYNEEHQTYYFEYGNKMLLVNTQLSREIVIEFAKVKMGI